MDEHHLDEIESLGETTFREKRRAFGIKPKDRRHHIYIIGKTGTGKSTLIKNMVIQDLRLNHGVALVDPHGDLVEDILNYIPKTRTNEVVYFNPADNEHPVAINILEAKGDEEKQLVASSLISVFRHLWKEFWGPRLEHILYNCVLALMDTPGQTLLGVYRMLVDDDFRKLIVANIKDPVVKMFWIEDYESYDLRFRKEIISPVQNKVGQLLTSPQMRNIVGQAKSSVDFGFVMDQKRILLANLSKGKVGEDKSNLLGSAIVTKMYLSALERQNLPEEVRKDFYLYIDEFQNFSTDIFPSILSEARKYRLNLNLAHQYLYQLPEGIKHAVFGNVGTVISFRVGSYDAKELSEEMKPVFTSEDLENLDNHHIALRLLIDGKMSHAFSAITFPPLKPTGREAERDTVLRISRERYATPRDIVEEKLKNWFEK
ncbi:MAG: type IV secretion system DNA-binding domain-containing protein [Parcubacteria group bacterium]|nr:type IV secretion system DNA-binding domain-containing protein [Parcubacteria group bacterium]